MSQTRDKRRRTDLDLFVLALIESGISTPYELQTTANLSPGATIPALQRLLESGFVRQGKAGSRGRTDHRITPAGKKLLKTGWRALVQNGPSGDLDADLRVSLLALAAGERRLAVNFLKRSADRKLESVAAIKGPEESNSLPHLAFLYWRLRSASAKALLKDGAAAAIVMAESLPRKLPRSATNQRHD